ncbi:DUF3303 domain-containing protein [Microvirga aerophila]|uniref:DUF3303 domain-containing protein n=1 Tax=Microvirga aerophila TaxID=670291 RepID=A0A512C1H1_9HYPH|nr:DUF3303 family protein [Microvirga aerophila]GEO17897.1 hypothetical protein MAE02_55930 [Microvirga aerophila]
MLFVVIAKAKAGSSGRERVARRVSWEYPAGMRMVAEYWPMSTAAAVIAIAEADSVASIMKAVVDWDDVFDLTVMPAMTAEQGLELAKQMQAGSSA